MPISGLVVTLSPQQKLRSHAIAILQQDKRLTVGPLIGSRLAVVAETNDSKEGVELVRNELLTITGIIFIDVVSVDFGDTILNDSPDLPSTKN